MANVTSNSPFGSSTGNRYQLLQTSGRNFNQFHPGQFDCVSIVWCQHPRRWLLHRSHRSRGILLSLEYQDTLVDWFYFPATGITSSSSSVPSSHQQFRGHPTIGHAFCHVPKSEEVQG